MSQSTTQPGVAAPPQMAQYPTMASAAASHLVNQQYQQQTSAAAAEAATAAQHQHLQQQPMMQPTAADLSNGTQGLAPNPAMAMAASAIVAGGQQQSVTRHVVKWVLSGDYLVLRDYPRGGPPPEYYVNLAYVQAPRFNRTPGEDGKTSISEPYAWEAKEYLANRLIGKDVVYQSEYNKSGGAQPSASGGVFGGNANKEFGIIYLGEENIVKTMVSEGLLEVRRSKGDSPVLQQLIEAEDEAKQAGRGRFSSQPAPKHELIHEHPDPSSLKGKTLTGTVENVRNGASIRVYLDLGIENGVHKHLNATIMVSGIRSPDKNRANEAKFIDEAKFFTESRLLNREVKVQIDKVERNSYLGSVTLGQNNLAEALLRQGMARCNDASITLTKSPEKFRAAEKEAKSKRLRIWENYVDASGDGPTDAYKAKIVEVISGDCMMAQNLATGEIKKIFLASIRLGAPVDRERQREAAKTSEPAADPEKPAKASKGKAPTSVAEPPKPSSVPRVFENPILYHARELLRKKLLGKKALVKVEYIQPKSDSYPEKICCSVRPADKLNWNASGALVCKGYASVVKYVSDDSQRASNFDELLKLEQNSLKTKYSKERQKALAPLKVIDLCNDVARAKQLLPFLSRSRKDGVIEFVFSASRFKVFLPKENNTLLNMVLAGVIVPREPEAIKTASTIAAKNLINQRDVSIQFESMDKKGNFIGWIYYKDEQTGKETSINLEMVKLGYGQVRYSSAPATLAELKAAETVARQKGIGYWPHHEELMKREEEMAAKYAAEERPDEDDDE